MLTFKYKILEFQPNDKMEKAFNDLGKEGWERVSVTPIGLALEGIPTHLSEVSVLERSKESSKRLPRTSRKQ